MFWFIFLQILKQLIVTKNQEFSLPIQYWSIHLGTYYLTELYVNDMKKVLDLHITFSFLFHSYNKLVDVEA